MYDEPILTLIKNLRVLKGLSDLCVDREKVVMVDVEVEEC